MGELLQLDCDVAVIGAGSAGICASLYSSINDAHTVLVEKKKIIGVPVRCGEFIPSKEVLKEMLPKARDVDNVYSLIPREAVVNRIRSIKFYSPRNRCFGFKFDGLVLKRDLMEQSITDKAAKDGVRVYTSSVVRGLKNDGHHKQVLVKNDASDMVLNAKVVVGADGFPSNVARWADMKIGYENSDMALTVQNVALNVDCDEDTVEMFTGNKYVPGGYGWIITKGGKIANVGLGVRLSHLRSSKGPSIRNYFEAFIKHHPLVSEKLSKAELTSFSAKMVPVGGEPIEICRGDVVLVGDAAGLVIATNGSGIPTAMVSGSITGKVVPEYLRGNCELSVYPARLREEVIPVIARGVAYRRVADLLMRSDRLFDTALRLIGAGNVSQILQCKKNFWSDLLQKIF